jgi:acyl-ACP thioesterase
MERASLRFIMKLLSELAGEHFERSRNLGHQELLDRGQVFLLSQLAISFIRTPVYSQEIVTQTWAREIKGPLLYRDYEIFGEGEELLAAASSAWIIADPVSRALLRPNSLRELPEMVVRQARCPDCKKLRRDAALEPLGLRPVYYSDIDGNGHVNNAVYGAIAMDFLPQALRERGVKDFHITFNQETKLGESLSIYGGEAAEGYRVSGEADGTLRFSAEFTFK